MTLPSTADQQRLIARLLNPEDGLVERKPSDPKGDEIRASACAFANTVAPSSSAVLFFGVADNGTILGVPNPESLQKKIRSRLGTECYPPIVHQCHVLTHDEKIIVAVEFPSSDQRPHFSGPAYVRRGSANMPASEQEYERLIASRNTTAGALERAIGNTWTVVAIGKRLGDTKPLQQPAHRESLECRIVDVTAHFVRLHHSGSGTNLTEELARAEISYDEEKHRPMLIVRGAA